MLTLLAWCLAPAFAQATTAPEIDLERFRPASDAFGYAVTRSAASLRAGRIGLGVWGQYAVHSPVLPYSAGLLELTERAVIDLQVVVGLHERVSVGVDLPLLLWQEGGTNWGPLPGSIGPGPSSWMEPLAAQGIGDARLEPYVVLLEPGPAGPLSLGVATELTLPTAERGALFGEGVVTVTPLVVAEVADGAVREREHTVRAALNLGARVKGADRWEEGLDEPFTFGPELLVRGAGAARVSSGLELGLDVLGVVGRGPDPVEVLPWVALSPVYELSITMGAGYGVNRGVGSPEARLFAGATLRPGDRPPPPPDADADGILDDDDACPAEPEDLDGVDDDDGCPEEDPPPVDTDGDGFADEVDACPEQPEDLDGVDDDDGCPDADPEHDTDGDGLLDAVDPCPFDAEDVDGFEDDDGCPEPDDDRDGVLDVADACPREPETANDYLDEDGCPDQAPSRVVVTRTALEIEDRIFFELGRAAIQPQSFPILEELATVVLEHPHILRIGVEGHTDDVGSDAVNLRLSQQRAEAVRDFLIEHGVDGSRLEAVGYGESRPIDTNRTDRGRARNRRVEFTILEQETR